MLPAINGFTLCNKIRDRDKDQPVIMLTAKSSEEDIITGLTLGADDYVAKPFSVRELVLRSGWVTEETRKKTYYDYIFFESERLSRLINNVLQLAKLENREIKAELTPVSPDLLLQRVKEKITAQIEASAFVLTVLPLVRFNGWPIR